MNDSDRSKAGAQQEVPQPRLTRDLDDGDLEAVAGGAAKALYVPYRYPYPARYGTPYRRGYGGRRGGY